MCVLWFQVHVLNWEKGVRDRYTIVNCNYLNNFICLQNSSFCYLSTRAHGFIHLHPQLHSAHPSPPRDVRERAMHPPCEQVLERTSTDARHANLRLPIHIPVFNAQLVCGYSGCIRQHITNGPRNNSQKRKSDSGRIGTSCAHISVGIIQ